MLAAFYLDEPYDNSKVDVFALGVVLVFIHTGYQPLLGSNNEVVQEVYTYLKNDT